LSFTENLRFGGGDDPVYNWPDTRVSVSVDHHGFIYVSDISESTVSRFTPKGVFVEVVIRKGQGPEELEALTQFQILKDGSARAYQYQGRAGLLKIFDTSLHFQKSLRDSDLGLTPLNILWSPSGDWAVIEFNDRDNQAHAITTHIGLLNHNMKLQKRFSSTRMPLPSPEKMSDRSFWVSFFAAISQLYFQNRTLIAFDQSNRVYLAESEAFLVTRWNSTFTSQEQTFQKSLQKQPWTPTDLDKLAEEISQQYTEAYPPALKPFLTTEIVREGLEEANPSHGKNPLAGLIVTDDDKLLVILNEDRHDGSQSAEVFEPDGSYLGRLNIPHRGLINTDNRPRMIFQGPHAYTMETVDEGVHQVVRYTVDWKPKIKP